MADLGHGKDISFNKKVVMTSDLEVSGTLTALNTTNLEIEDNNITLGDVTTPTDTTANGGGFTLKGTTDKTITWDNANDNWTSNQNWNVATGLGYKINNTTVLNATALTLGGNSIGASELGYLNGLNQSLAVTDDPIFAEITFGGIWTLQNSGIQGQENAGTFTITEHDQSTFKLHVKGSQMDFSRGSYTRKGTGMFLFSGPAGSNPSGPHAAYTVSTDSYPVRHDVNWDHDNVGITFDAYIEGDIWKSSDVGSNYKIYKNGDVLAIKGDSGIAAGSTLTWDLLASWDPAGSMYNKGRITTLAVSSWDGDVWMTAGQTLTVVAGFPVTPAIYIATFSNYEGNNVWRNITLLHLGGSNHVSAVTPIITAVGGTFSFSGSNLQINNASGFPIGYRWAVVRIS